MTTPPALSPSWIDGHLDLAWAGLERGHLDGPPPAGAAVSWASLEAGGIDTAFATIFTEMDGPPSDPASYAAGDAAGAEAAGRRQLDWYLDQERRGRIGIVRSIDDLERREGLQVVLLMECADPIRSPEDAAWWVARGVRLVGMSWGRGSRYAGGNATPGPLTASGRELVSTLDDLGVGHDASHLSRASFDDLLERSTGPVCATHSNAAALIGDDPRHLLDDQIRAIGDRDGIVGLNLFGRFLAKDRRATLADCLDHVEHAASIIGRRRLALGSDADGGFGSDELPVELERLDHLDRLAKGLRDRGWSTDEVDGFRRGNWLRWLRGLDAFSAGSAVTTTTITTTPENEE